MHKTERNFFLTPTIQQAHLYRPARRHVILCSCAPLFTRFYATMNRQRRRTRVRSERSTSPSEASPERSPPKKRRRIISSDSSEPGPGNENTNVAVNVQTDDENNDDIFSLLGEDPTQNKEYSEDIHAHLAVRWNHILATGVKKEQRLDLLKKYLPPANCNFLEAPKLNEEIKAAVQESSLKRDEKLVTKQSQLGSGITCIGRALDAAFKIPDKQLRDQIIKHLGDGGQILCDLHYLETVTRRFLVAQGLNKSTKEAVKNLTRDKLLFGEGLTETLKAVKACSRSAGDIKNKPARVAQRGPSEHVAGPSTSRSTTLNWRGPSRRPAAYAPTTAGGYRERRPAAAPPPRRVQPARSARAPPPARRY
ncbi:hypothetical protein MSG28_011316 [Choristoneura fumiferana]|uniref:Uncharacterized protein n=1 Tax=Choristoneura fumiferana TaxID=7141 RepID=A0ACC0KRV7_CHOFU|nr:hypothetical protein MSG28_011316 [Choristoneura fumiferana]